MHKRSLFNHNSKLHSGSYLVNSQVTLQKFRIINVRVLFSSRYFSVAYILGSTVCWSRSNEDNLRELLSGIRIIQQIRRVFWWVPVTCFSFNLAYFIASNDISSLQNIYFTWYIKLLNTARNGFKPSLGTIFKATLFSVPCLHVTRNRSQSMINTGL